MPGITNTAGCREEEKKEKRAAGGKIFDKFEEREKK
jgi:hypothetical protein